MPTPKKPKTGKTAPAKIDTGKVTKGKVAIPTNTSKHAVQKPPVEAPWPLEKRVGFAIVGLGRLSLEELLPAFRACKYAKVSALVSGTAEKAETLAAQYGVPPSAIYTYDTFEALANNPDVEVIFIVLPNAMHRDFVERAAKIGKHVLCEKPLADDVRDAEAMVAACAKAGVKLMTAYRCQFEPYNRKLVEIARSGRLGGIRFIEATNIQSQGAPNQWRQKQGVSGGGALPDIGIYCLNAARYVTGEEPEEVFAYLRQPKDDPRFKQVEEAVSFMLRFPSGVIANCATSYDGHDTKKLTVRLEKGWIELDGAFAYRGKTLKVAEKHDGVAIISDLQVGEQNQFALEIDHMADCVRQNRQPRTPGEEGVADQRIIEALYLSARTGKPVALKAPKKLDSTRGPALKPL